MTQVVPVSTNQSYVFDERYVLLNAIGRGHNSIIYKAKRLSDVEAGGPEPLVAVKIVTGSPRSPEKNIDRVEREGLGLLASRHPNVVRLIDYVTEGEYCYLVVEYAESGDMKAALERRSSPFLPETVLQLALKVLGGLESIHRAGIIHRDLKPENLLLFADGTVKIADFGVCLLPTDDPDSARASSSVGTLDYLAPECLEGAGCSQASDVYCLGVTCYQLLTKHMPFEGESFSEIVENKVNGNSIPLERFIGNAPAMLNELFKQAFHADPAERFQNVAEFRDAINSYMKGSWRPARAVAPTQTLAHARLREPEVNFFEQVETRRELPKPQYRPAQVAVEEFEAEIPADDTAEEQFERPALTARFSKLQALRRPKTLGAIGAVALLVIIGIGVKNVFTPRTVEFAAPAMEQPEEVDARAMLGTEVAPTSFSGGLSGLLSDADFTALHIETQNSGATSLLILGLPGWTPQAIDIKSLQQGEPTSVASNGLLLTFVAERNGVRSGSDVAGSDEAVDTDTSENINLNSSGVTSGGSTLAGTFVEQSSGRKGRWSFSSQSF